MATTRLMPLHTGKGRTVGQAISDIIDYSKNPQKTDNGRLITSWQCDSRIADAEFLFTKNQYIQKTGRIRGEDDVIAYHLRQSFVPGEITPEEANRLGCELAKRFTKGKHAYIVCTHIDREHIHNHLIWNSTALDQTRKFRNFWGSTRAVRRLNDTICIENGYSIVENPKRHGKSYNKWLGDKKKPSHRERICAAIDDALAKKPESFEALLELLRQAGYKIKGKKVPSLLGGEQQKSIRMDTLGAGYTPEDLRAVIAGEKEHTPRKRWTEAKLPEKRGGNLLVDIQAKLQEGKGAGYARWATLFNLKQMAQTVDTLPGAQQKNVTPFAKVGLHDDAGSSGVGQHLAGVLRLAAGTQEAVISPFGFLHGVQPDFIFCAAVFEANRMDKGNLAVQRDVPLGLNAEARQTMACNLCHNVAGGDLLRGHVRKLQWRQVPFADQ